MNCLKNHKKKQIQKRVPGPSSVDASTDTYSYKKINHKKYIECEINLLRDVIAKLHADFDIFAVCIHEIYYKRCNAEYEHEHHLKTEDNFSCIFLTFRDDDNNKINKLACGVAVTILRFIAGSFVRILRVSMNNAPSAQTRRRTTERTRERENARVSVFVSSNKTIWFVSVKNRRAPTMRHSTFHICAWLN